MNNLTEQNNTQSPVRLKGVGDSLWVTLDPNQPMDVLKAELNKIFNRMKQLVINSRVVIDTGGEDEHKGLIEKLGGFLTDVFHVSSVSGPPKKRALINNTSNKPKDMPSSLDNYQTDVLMLSGRVRSGQKITAKKNLVILGDVNPGGEVLAGGDIIILGCLSGTAIAGQPDNEQAIVLALDFKPTQIQIAGNVAAGLSTSSGKSAEYAYIENGSIIVEDYLKANPFGRLPWPQIR